MNDDLDLLVQSFSGINALVIGESMLDTYSSGPANRLCREAPVPIISITEQHDRPGGAANTAVNIASLGANVTFLSVTGDDGEGALLRGALEDQGVSPGYLLVESGRRSLRKHRVCAGSQMIARLDSGDTGPISPESERALIARLRGLAPLSDCIVVSDYGYGIMSPAVIDALGELQTTDPRLLLVDSRSLPAYRDAGVTGVKPNYEEAIQLLGLDPALGEDKAQHALAAGERILESLQVPLAAITLDSEGAVVFQRGAGPYRTYAHPAENPKPTGAGDTFLGVFALALASGASTPAAAELASAGAAIVVRKERTATCSRAELLAYVSGREKRVRDRRSLETTADSLRQQGRRIVFTNGCFDILHAGHIAYLNQAKALGDVLVVGVNSDRSVGRLKGPARPINRLDDRLNVLSALSCVDYLVPFNEDTPIELLRSVQPHVFVKGGDYTREMLPEAPLVESLGGEVVILPYVEDRSTSGIIARIRSEAEPAFQGR